MTLVATETFLEVESYPNSLTHVYVHTMPTGHGRIKEHDKFEMSTTREINNFNQQSSKEIQHVFDLPSDNNIFANSFLDQYDGRQVFPL